MKTLIVFDLDGTLAESKSALDSEMGRLLGILLRIVKVAVISGGNWPKFERQLIAQLPRDERRKRLLLLPTCGTQFFRYEEGWKQLYAEDLSPLERRKIVGAIKDALAAARLDVKKVWGEVIEDRGSQITLSALGQLAPLAEKARWDPDLSKRRMLKARLDELLPEFSVRLGGTTSVDITKRGIDKGYGIHKLRDILQVPIHEMVFVGDALFSGGNDHPAKEAGVTSIQVSAPSETKRVIETIIACLDGAPQANLLDDEAP